MSDGPHIRNVIMILKRVGSGARQFLLYLFFQKHEMNACRGGHGRQTEPFISKPTEWLSMELGVEALS
jgi:hypothetical protein